MLRVYRVFDMFQVFQAFQAFQAFQVFQAFQMFHPGAGQIGPVNNSTERYRWLFDPAVFTQDVEGGLQGQGFDGAFLAPGDGGRAEQ